MGRDVPGNYDTVDNERTLYGGCYTDIHDRELVPGALVVSQTLVAQEEPRQKAV
jgi:hypothetical protein